MFAEEFHKMIQDPIQLGDVPLSDMKVIAERYPYCQAIHILLARKMHLTGSPLFEQQLKQAAVMAYDREQLFHVIHQSAELAMAGDAGQDSNERLVLEEEPVSKVQPEIPVAPEIPAVTEPEVVLEQEEEAIVQEMIESIPEITPPDPQPEEIPVFAPLEEIAEAEALLEEENLAETLEHAAKADTETPETQNFIHMPDEQPDFDRDLLFDRPAYDIERELGVLEDAEKFTLPPITPEMAAETNTEVQTDTFEGWLFRLSGKGSGRVVEPKDAHAPVRVYLRRKPAPGEDMAEGTRDRLMNEQVAADLARKSIQMDTGIISETYARILVMQGKYAKAIEMYTQLSLLKPQKSDYFAALIEQIRKKTK